MGADSIALDDSQDFCLVASPKVFRSQGLLFGCTGEFRYLQALAYDMVIPARNAHPKDDERWICSKLVNAIRQSFRRTGAMELKDGREQAVNFVVGYRGRVYQIESTFSVLRSTRGYDAVGCGSKYALGALYANYLFGYPPEERIRLALEAAEVLNAGVRGPFTILRERGKV